MNYFHNIRPGDLVTFHRFHPLASPSTGRGKAVLCFPTHVVLNCGGRHGTPAVVDERNFVSARRVK